MTVDRIDPEDGVEQRHSQDCLRACLATIFRLPYEAVPDPLDRDREEGTEGRWRSALYEWLHAEFGLIPWEFGIWGDEWPLLKFGGADIEYSVSPPGCWIAQVQSPRIEGTHAVVMKGRRLIWDPHPQRAEGHRGYRQAMVFMPRETGSVGKAANV